MLAAGVMLLLLTAPVASAQPSVDLFAATGYDTNPARVTEAPGDAAEPTQADQLELVLWRSQLRGRLLRTTGYTGTLEGGAKRFRDSSDEDSLIVRGSFGLRQRLAGPAGATLGVSLKDRHQPDDRRSYRTGSAHTGLSLKGPAGWQFAALAMLQAYRYLPDPRYDHQGWGGHLAAAWQQGRFRMNASVQWLALEFEGVRTLRGGVIDSTGAQREDDFLRADMGGSYVGPAVASVEVYAQRGESTSWGSSNVRLGGTGSVAVALGGAVDLSFRGTLLLAQYDDLSSLPAIDEPVQGVDDEETRSSVAVALRRPVVDPLQLELRYSHYFNAGDGAEYRRHLLVVGVRVALEP